MKLDKDMLLGVQAQFRLDCNLPVSREADPQGGVYIGKTPFFYQEGSDGRIELGQPDDLRRYRKEMPDARLYEGKDLFFRGIIFLGRVYLMTDDAIYRWCGNRFLKNGVTADWFCEFSNLRILDNKLSDYKRKIDDTHIFFLPDADADAAAAEPDFPVRWFEREELKGWGEETPFSNALCFSQYMPDMLAAAAMDGGKMIGLAGATADCETMWQVGVDVLPEYRNRGLAVKLTALLRQEILRRGKIPFYGTNESHSISRYVAVKAGFLPAWTEINVIKQ